MVAPRETPGGTDSGARIGLGVLDKERGRLAERLSKASQTIRETGQRLSEKEDSTLSRLVGRLAESLEKAGGYIGTAEPRAILRDANDLARRQPEIVLGGALVAGLMLGRFLRSEPPDAAENQSPDGAERNEPGEEAEHAIAQQDTAGQTQPGSVQEEMPW